MLKRKGINHAWHIGQPPYFLLERAIDLVMLLGVAVLAFIVVVFSTNVLGLASLAKAPAWLGGGPVGKVLLEILALGLTVGVFLLLYRYVPNTKVAGHRLGALMGAVLFQGVRVGFTWFVATFGSFSLVYGSLGALMAVLVWAYLSAMALMWGAQVAFTYSRVLGEQAGMETLPQPKVGASPRRRGFLGMLLTVAGWLLPPKRSPTMRLTRPTEVVPGVYQLRAIGAKVTALFCDGGVVPVDAGGRGSLGLIASGLRALNASLEHVQLIVLTHYYPDHRGGLAELVKATSAKVAAHRQEAGILNGNEPLRSPFRNPVLAAMSKPFLPLLNGRPVEVDYVLDDGDTLPLTKDIQVVHSPGHTPGSTYPQGGLPPAVPVFAAG